MDSLKDFAMRDASPPCAEPHPAPHPAPPSAGMLHVLSCGAGLPESAARTALRCGHVFASRSLLARLPQGAYQAHAIAREPERDANEAIALVRQGCTVAVLASGDALYHGMGATLARVLERLPLPRECVRFHPGVTAFQVLCHRLGLAWSQARLFSAHAQEPPLRQILEQPLAIVYAGSRLTASDLASALCRLHPASRGRACVLAELLGSPGERIVRTSLGEAARQAFGPTSILVLLPQGFAPLPLALGLPDSCWRFQGHLVTSPEVRACALARLRLPSRGVLWDLGAGSGSVGLEAAALRPGLEVWGVERRPERLADMEANRKGLGVANYRAVGGEILERLPELPDPDRIFIGGGGAALAAIAEASLARLAPCGICVASAVTLESQALLAAFRPDLCQSVLSLDAAEARGIGRGLRLLEPRHRIHLFVFQAPDKPEPDKENAP